MGCGKAEERDGGGKKHAGDEADGVASPACGVQCPHLTSRCKSRQSPYKAGKRP